MRRGGLRERMGERWIEAVRYAAANTPYLPWRRLRMEVNNIDMKNDGSKRKHFVRINIIALFSGLVQFGYEYPLESKIAVFFYLYSSEFGELDNRCHVVRT